MNNKIIPHENRALLEIKGLDRKKFLQGLITNDVEKASDSNLIYAVMLSPQGRFLYDFFIFEIAESLMLDCFEPRRDEILKKLNFYKLRSKVEIVKNDELLVAQALENNNFANSFVDPRNKNLGYRVYLPNSSLEGCTWTPQQVRGDNSQVQGDNLKVRGENLEVEGGNFKLQIEKVRGENLKRLPPHCHPALVAGSILLDSDYNFLRISNKIAESELDLIYDKSFILEFGFDELNAIDYQKGCYVGQELTARTHYRGEIRKKLLHITIDNLQKIEKGQEISCEGKSVGIVLSSVFHNDELHALALIRSENSIEEIKNLEFEKNKITVIS
jgi:tRNA-modifying protein YgfZ